MSLIDKIKADVTIEDVAARYSNHFWPRGATVVCRCLCGGNTDRHPSFTLYPSQSSFYCFACNRGGDVINLVELADKNISALSESMRRPGAVQALASWYGITSTDSRTDAQAIRRPVPPPAVEHVVADDVKAILEAATTYYENALTKHQDVIGYLVQKRGLAEPTLKHLRIGYSDGQLARALSLQGFDLGLAARIGLLTPNGEKLRGRIIFPVMDKSLAPVWMLGRAFSSDTEPKYDGLPDGLTQKRPMVFGRPKKGIILVEGVLDCAALVQWQIHAEWMIVAILGTGHRKVIDKLVKACPGARVIVLLDQDKPGKEAALKAADALIEGGLEPKIAMDRDRQTKVEAFLSAPNKPAQAMQKAQSELKVVEEVQKRNLAHWVYWGASVKDPGDLLQLGEQGRGLLLQAIE
ncbi:MAG: toprim domain-containing protein [Anaerolineae bacterium]|nr:toprim domain-containing protein [Anaerolineae bacterium]